MEKMQSIVEHNSPKQERKDGDDKNEYPGKNVQRSFSLQKFGEKIQKTPGVVSAAILAAALRGDIQSEQESSPGLDYLRKDLAYMQSNPDYLDSLLSVGLNAHAEGFRMKDIHSSSPLEERLLYETSLQIAQQSPENIIYETDAALVEKQWFQEVFDMTLPKALSTVVGQYVHPRLRLSHSVSREQHDSIVRRKRDALMTVFERSGYPFKNVVLDIIRFDVGSGKLPFEEADIKEKVTSVFFLDIAKGKMSIDDAISIVKDNERFFHALVNIYVDTSSPIEKKEIAQKFMKSSVLRVIQSINEAHDREDEVRFKSIENASAEELYLLMTYGDEEIFTSTFNGLFDRMMAEMKERHLPGDEFLRTNDRRISTIFIRMCSQFNRLDEFLKTMDPDVQRSVLANFIKDIEVGDEAEALFRLATVSEAILAIQDAEILSILDNTIRTEYERSTKNKDKKGEMLYGFLSSAAKKNAAVYKEWFLDQGERYPLPVFDAVDIGELFDVEGVNVQQYFFYNDEDGKNSFKNFLAGYGNNSKWKISRFDKYIRIDSVAGKNVSIYANYPETDNDGIDAVKTTLASQGKHPQIIVHRGHSFHAGKTIQNIDEYARIVVLGSCGGFRNIESVLAKSSDANILSTKGTGTMNVNDPILLLINNYILQGKDIRWSEVWSIAKSRLGDNPHFKNYVSPEENMIAAMITAYHRKMKE